MRSFSCLIFEMGLEWDGLSCPSQGVEPSLEVGAGAAGDKATELPQATLENEDHQPLLTSV